MEPNTSVCNCGGDVQSSRKSKSNADGFCMKSWLLLVIVLKVVLTLKYLWIKAVFKMNAGRYPARHRWCHAAVWSFILVALSVFSLRSLPRWSYELLVTNAQLNCYGIIGERVGRNLCVFQHRGGTLCAFVIPGFSCSFPDSPPFQRCSISSCCWPKLLLLLFKSSGFQTCRTIYSLALHALRLFPNNLSQSSFSRLNLSSFNIIQLVGHI